MDFILDPVEIEKKSFDIIGGLLDSDKINDENIAVVKRVIHTTADFDYAQNLVFSENAYEYAVKALKAGANIVTDTQMAKAGINKKNIESLGCSVHCFIDSGDVADMAKKTGVTRASVAVEYAAKQLNDPIVFVVGNAPTALIKLHHMIVAGRIAPAFIIGTPVGFVNVVESKELIMSLKTPYIVAKGRKGGSNVAAAICNALTYGL